MQLRETPTRTSASPVSPWLKTSSDEAVGFYENALSIEGTNFNALSGLIRLYARKNELAKATRESTRCLNSLSKQRFAALSEGPDLTVSSETPTQAEARASQDA